MGIEPGDRFAVMATNGDEFLELYHAAFLGAGVINPPTGGTTVFQPLFDPVGVMELIEEHRVTQTTMVPTMIGMVMNHPEFSPARLASLKALTYGASPMPSALLDRLLDTYPDLEITQGYGMTESSSVLTFLTAEDLRKGGPRLRTAGRAVPGVVLSIRDADATPCPKVRPARCGLAPAT